MSIVPVEQQRSGKPYPAYRDSGMPWLDRIPVHWDLHRLKHIVQDVIVQKIGKAQYELYIALEHIESMTGKLLLPETPPQFSGSVKCFAHGDVLFSKLRPYLAKAIIASQDGVCVGELLVLRPD